METPSAHPCRRAWGILALLLLGLALRSYHYLRNPSVWHDEAALLLNILTKDFGELLGPLRWHQAAAPLFLWVERAVFLALGDSALALRLVPFLGSCAALLLMIPVARTLLPRPAVLWAVLLFACSEQLAWHACEAKPYALDVLSATLVLAVYAAGRQRGLVWLLAAAALLAPLLMFLSYPACFLYGGLLAALLPAVGRQGRLSVRTGYVLLALTVLVAFAVLVKGPIRAQRDGAIVGYWVRYFPDWSRPWSVPAWMASSTLGVFRYCCKPIGEGLALLAVVGAVGLWRTGQRSLVVLLLLPVLLALAAACLHRYPYCGTRLMVYAAPALILLIAAGVPPTLAWLRTRGRPAVLPLVILLCLPAVAALRRVMVPWPRADMVAAAAWLHAHRAPADPVVANDWTHFYYFRQLGDLCQDSEKLVRRARERIWVVYTGRCSAADRLRKARARVAGGWVVREHREFEFTTVLLLARRTGGAGRLGAPACSFAVRSASGTVPP